MNIFFLDRDPAVAAQLHCDKHVVKMVLETAQILSSVHHRYENPVTYKPTHQKHPCVLWAGSSPMHYRWTQQLGEHLSRVYTHRHGKQHKSGKLIRGELELPPFRLAMSPVFWEDPPQCMPDEHKDTDPVLAYQRYYRVAKYGITTWAMSVIPEFMYAS